MCFFPLALSFKSKVLSGCIIFGKRRNRGRSLKSSAGERERSKWLKQRGRKEHFGITPPFYVIGFSRRQADQSSGWLIFDQIDIGWWDITINSPNISVILVWKYILQFKFKCKQRPHDYTHEYLWTSIIETHIDYVHFFLKHFILFRMFLALLLNTTWADDVQPWYGSLAGNGRNRVTTSRHRYVFYFSHIVVDFQQRCACSQ